MVYKSGKGWERDFENKPVATMIKASVIAVIVILGLTYLVWGMATGFSFWWGRAGATQDKNSSTNFEESQALFHRDLNEVKGDRVKIQLAQQALAQWKTAHPGYVGNGTPFDPIMDEGTRDQTNLTGLTQGCLNEVNDYNTAAESFLTQDWRDANLPPSLDVTTACDPTKSAPAG